MYDDLLDDPKVQRLDPVLFKTWVNLLCLASRNDGRLPSTEDIAFSLRVDESVAVSRLSELIDKGLIDEDEGISTPHNWDKRQFKSDKDETAAERKRKQRTKGRDGHGDVTRDTGKDVTRTEQSRTETDTEQSRAEPAHAQDPIHWKEVQGYLQKPDNLTDWEVDFLHSIKWAETITKSQSSSLKAINDKLQSSTIGKEVFVVKKGSPEFSAWIDHKRGLGQRTAFLEAQESITVPSLMPPEAKAA